MEDLIAVIPTVLGEAKALWDAHGWIVEVLTAAGAAIMLVRGVVRFTRRTLVPVTSFGWHFANIKQLIKELDEVLEADARFKNQPGAIAAYAGGWSLWVGINIVIMCSIGFAVTNDVMRAALMGMMAGFTLSRTSKPMLILRYLSNPQRFLDRSVEAVRKATDRAVAAAENHSNLESVRPMLTALKKITDVLGEKTAAVQRPESTSKPGD